MHYQVYGSLSCTNYLKLIMIIDFEHCRPQDEKHKCHIPCRTVSNLVITRLDCNINFCAS